MRAKTEGQVYKCWLKKIIKLLKINQGYKTYYYEGTRRFNN